MTRGIGIDIAQIDRYRTLGENTIRHILSPCELEEFHSLSEKSAPAFLASRFAAKEALVKALGTGFGPVMAHDLTVAHDGNGRPYFTFSEKAEALFSGLAVHLSISHERDYAAAMVVLDGKD